MAKPFSETVNIQPQTVATGQPQALMSLSEKLDQFAGFTAQIAAEKTVEKASIAGQQAAADLAPGEAPTMKEETFIGGIAKKAYNSALRSSYVGTVSRDLTLNLNAIKDKNADNLPMFNEEANAAIKGAVEGADPATRQLILQDAANFMDSARIDVQTANIQRNMEEADAEAVLTSEYFGSEADKHAFNGDALSSMESLNKTIAAIDGRVSAGAIDSTQAAILKDAAIFSTKVATNRGDISRALQMDNGIEIASKAVSQMAEKPLKGLTLEQNDQLVKTLNSDISQFITNQNRQESADQVTLTARQNNNFTQLMVNMAEGELNQTMLNMAAKNGDINGSQFDKLTTKLSTQGVGVTDISTYLNIQNSIEGGENMTDAIVNNMGANLTTADGGELLRMQQEYNDSESALNTNNAKRARSYMKESMKVTGILGNLTDDAAKKTASAVREFDERVLAGEEPFAVADDLYDRDTLIKLEGNAGNQGFDTDNVSSAIEKLRADTLNQVDDAAGSQAEIDNIKSKYERQLKLLQQIQSLQISQKGFDQSIKEFK